MHLEYEVCLAERSGASIFFHFCRVQVRVRAAAIYFFFTSTRFWFLLVDEFTLSGVFATFAK